MHVYLAGPIQHVNDNGIGWRSWLKQNYKRHVWIDPLDKYNAEINAEWSDERIVDEDLELIDGCGAMLVHFEEVPSTGTPREIGYIDPKTGRGPNIPLVVQTTVPYRELSPWLTDALDDPADVCETFVDAVARLNYYEQKWEAAD